MSILGLLDFSDVEKEVMMYISRNSGKLCTIHSIYNDIVEERNIVNPEIKNDLKIKLQIVMSQLNSKQSNVTVIKRDDTYLVGYNMDSTSNSEQTPPIVMEPGGSAQFDTSGLAKTMFEYIVDNNINYPIGPDCNGENLLFVGIMLNDYSRVRKLKSKLHMSFFDRNSDGKNLMDLYPTNLFIHQQCIEELAEENTAAKKRENEHLAMILRINNEIIGLEKSILKLKQDNTQRNIYDIYVIAFIFISIWWFRW
jgi:hypothetical protein